MYQIAVDQDIFDTLKAYADDKGLPVAELVRKYLQVGIVVQRLEDSPDAQVMILASDGTARQLVI
jgi:hypothetical protein